MGARAVLPYEGIDATAHAAVGEVVGRGAGERDDSREVRKRGVTSLYVGQTFLSASLWPDRNVWPTRTTFFGVGKPEQTFLSAFLWPDRKLWPTRCATAAPRAPSRARAYASRQRAPESSDRSDSRRSRGRRESRS